MTKDTLLKMAELIASMRRDIDAVAAKRSALEAERNELAAHVSAHVDALKQSNAQCGEYLRQNEQLHSQLVEVRAALASVSAERDSLKRTMKEWETAETKPHARVAADDIADHVVPPVLPLCGMCHGCGSPLGAWGPGIRCHNQLCNRTTTGALCLELSPFHGPCNSPRMVRHE
jgi:chromosome segregation ATPase